MGDLNNSGEKGESGDGICLSADCTGGNRCSASNPPKGLSFSGIHLLHTEPLPSVCVHRGRLRGNMINYWKARKPASRMEPTHHNDTFLIPLPMAVYVLLITAKNNNLSFNRTLSRRGLSPLLFFPFILVCDSAGLTHSLHQCPCDLIHAAYLSRSVFFHKMTNAHTLWPQKLLEQWKGLPEKLFRQNLRGWLESFNSNKAGRKACLLLVIPHLLDKASQGSSAALNWCTYPYLYRSSLWLGVRGESDRTGSYSSPHAYLLILIHGRIGFFRSHFSSYAWHGIFIEPATTNAAV